MFEESILKTREKARRPVTLAISAAMQCVAVSAMVLAPLAFTDRLPLKLDLTPHPPLRVRRAVPIVEARPTVPRGTVVRYRQNVLFAPRTIPPLTLVVDPPTQLVDGPTNDDRMPVAGLPFGLETGNDQAGRAYQPPPPVQPRHVEPPPVQVVKRDPVRVSSGVLQAKAIRQPKPLYPPMAKATRTQGVVKLIGVIAKDGTIQQLQVISGHPLLVTAAVEAVKQWLYQPTLLNGEPVEVIAPIDVNFTLQ